MMLGEFNCDYIQFLHDPDSSLIGDSEQEFLKYLGQTSAIFITGEDHTRTRAVCTLLHGNEPSGFSAIFHYLKSKNKPVVNTLFIIASVQAASLDPLFSHRMPPQQRDLNRSFTAPYDDHQGEVANAIIKLIHLVNPECLIDIHNTSGSGPAFAVAIKEDNNHKALTSLFTSDLIVTDLRLGALMELSEQDLCTVTIECGGVKDVASLLIAQEGLHRYLSTQQVLAIDDEQYPVNVYHNPIRLETIANAPVAYGHQAQDNAVITLPLRADKFNYGMLTKDELIGYLRPNGLKLLTAKDHLGVERLGEYFVLKGDELYARHPLKVFMATTNAFIAKTDCLFYFIGA
jgi:hypothetical protein